MSALEAALEGFFRTRVTALGGMVEKVAPTSAGMPDRMVLIHGQVHLVELKTDTGKLRPGQVLWHAKAAQRGVRVVVLSGKAEIIAWLAELVQSAEKPVTTVRLRAAPEYVRCHTCQVARSVPNALAADSWLAKHPSHSTERSSDPAVLGQPWREE